MSVTEPEYLFVPLGTQHAMCMSQIVVCGLPRSTVFSSLSHTRDDFFKKSNLTYNVCFDFLYNVYPKHFSF
jgi:hypothetical protein